MNPYFKSYLPLQFLFLFADITGLVQLTVPQVLVPLWILLAMFPFAVYGAALKVVQGNRDRAGTVYVSPDTGKFKAELDRAEADRKFIATGFGGTR